MQIKRYDLYVDDFSEKPVMQQELGGDWVKWDDVKRLVETHNHSQKCIDEEPEQKCWCGTDMDLESTFDQLWHCRVCGSILDMCGPDWTIPYWIGNVVEAKIILERAIETLTQLGIKRGKQNETA